MGSIGGKKGGGIGSKCGQVRGAGVALRKLVGPTGVEISGRRSSRIITIPLRSYTRSWRQLENRSMEFCNAFWGLNDPGYEVLLARMRIAGKTIEDLRNFWRER